jgi:transcriptional regulator with XRE-family HTH domain
MNEILKRQFLTQKEVAELFRVSTNTVGNWEKRGLFSRWQAPGSTRVLYLSDEIKDFRDKNLKPRGEGAKPKQINGIKKGKPVVSTKTDKDWRI